MTALLEHVARLFVAPEAGSQGKGLQWLPPGPPTEPDSATGCPTRIAVVCSPRDAGAAGGAAALAVAHGTGASLVTVVEWTGEPVREGRDRAAAPGARRAAAVLRQRGHAARANGRVVRVSVAADEAAAWAEARAVLAHVESPSVLVVAGPRAAGMEVLLTGVDLVVLAVRRGADAELAALAVEELELGLRGRVACAELASSPVALALARSGTALVAPLRSAFVAAIGAS